MAFWSYIIASIIEYPIIKKRFKCLKSFFIPRLFSAVIVPWVIFLIWYLVPAIYGKFHIESFELVWAIVVSILSGIIGVIFEREIQEKEQSTIFIIVVIILLLISAFLYVRFTYKLPWIDMFVDPLKL
uniref:Uncharacterized protein n=1 Tax=candidate division WOR-3 bacterium TaxID=2052148 RepID=A0A7C4YJE1_UNCW3